MSAYVPPGWPTGVHPPGSQDFERTAVAWLLDVVPPDYRLYGVLRRYPVALATLAAHHIRACVEGARQGYRTARTQLSEALPAQALDAVLAAYRTEGRRLTEAARAVDLVAAALRGETFTPQLRDPAPPDGRAPGDPALGAGQGAGMSPPERPRARPTRQARSPARAATSRDSRPPRPAPSNSKL